MLKGSPDHPRWIRVCRGRTVGSMFRAESWESFTRTSSAPAAALAVLACGAEMINEAVVTGAIALGTTLFGLL